MANIVEGILKDIKKIPTSLKGKTRSLEYKTVILKTLPYVICGYVADKFSYAYHVSSAPDTLHKLMEALGNGKAFESFMPSLAGKDLLVGVIAGVGLRIMVYLKSQNAKKFRKGVEYGSARWGTPKDIEPYMDASDFENNILLTATERLQMNGRAKSPKYARNKNVLVIGGSGSGKTRFFVKPSAPVRAV